MGQIRKQTLQLSFLTYIGFIIGALNTYFLARLFTPEQYGLTQVIISIAAIMAPLGVLGTPAFMTRFFPYYFDYLDKRRNDMLTVSVLVSAMGAVLVFSGAMIFEPLVVRKFTGKSPLVVKYYHWSLVFAFFYLCFLVLESYLGALKKTVLPGFMKETGYRIFIMLITGLYATRLISFDTFVILFCCIYLLVVLILVVYLIVSGQLYLPLRFSHVTRRLRKRIVLYVGFVYSSVIIHSLAAQISTLAVAGARSLGDAGVFALNQFSAAILQVPYRSMQNIASVLISTHWKNRNYPEIEKIYRRSAINLLLMSMFLFFNLWLNYDDGLKFLGIYDKFAPGKTVFLILGIYNILELGTGLNTSLLGTSPAWRFEFYSGLFLLAMSIPLNIFMARRMGMEGVALATLITFTIYNALRLIFIYRRFNMWPFSMKTIYAIVMTLLDYALVYYLLHNLHGIGAVLLRGVLFSGVFIAGTWWLHLTPDLREVTHIIKKRLGR